MKYKIITLSFLFISTYVLYAQDRSLIKNSLVITIRTDRNKIIMDIGADTSVLLKNLSSINPDKIGRLVINNKTNKNDFSVLITHTVGAGQDAITFTGTDIKKMDTTIYEIKNGSILKKPFSFNSNFSIQIKNFNGDVTGPIILQPKSQGGDAGTKKNNSMKVPGIPVYDAIFLANNISGARQKVDTIRAILSFYANEKNVPSIDSLKKLYIQNKFITEYLNLLPQPDSTTITGQADKPINFLSSALSSIGGLDVTNLADGAAKFIVKRAKQELSIAFFQKFKKIIQGTPDLGTVFPQTANLLEGLDEEIYEYEKYIQNLREAFKKDIQEIHRNLPGIIDNHPGFFSEHQEVKVALLTACYTAQELEDQAHPGDILANYPVEYLDSIKNKNYKGAIQTIQLLSASLRDTSAKDDATYWVNIKQIRELVNDKLALKIYLGLILQEAKIKYEGVVFEGTTLVELLNKVADKYEKGFAIYNSYKTFILRFGEKVEALNKMIKDQSKENISDSLAVEKYAKYFRTAVDLVEYSVEICRLPIIKELRQFEGFPLLLKKYFDVAYSSADLVVDITRKNYSSAINHAVHIYNLVTVKSEEGIPVPQNDEHSNILSDSQVVRNDIKAKSENKTAIAPKDFKPTYDKLIKYGSFMATVATAKNSDEVEKAIETAALPVGSSRIKRVSDFNVSLNTYAGLFYGIERIKGIDSGATKFNAFGVAAPIGVAASCGHSLFFFPTGKSEWSTSIFVSLIDLGAIAAFRFRDDSTAQVPSIELKDIFSPGAFLSIGIPKTPLSFNLGVQVGPNLRKVGDGKNDYGNNVYWRYSASLCVDIPVLNFYAKSK